MDLQILYLKEVTCDDEAFTQEIIVLSEENENPFFGRILKLYSGAVETERTDRTLRCKGEAKLSNAPESYVDYSYEIDRDGDAFIGYQIGDAIAIPTTQSVLVSTTTPIPTVVRPEPTSTSTPTSAPRPTLGSRENPVHFGTVVEVKGDDERDHWAVSVVDVVPDSTSDIISSDSFVDPPQAGNQFYVAKVKVKYLGPESAQFGGVYRLKALGASGLAYTWVDNDCGFSIPDALTDRELFTGGEIEGNVCWEIDSSDAEALTMFLDESLYSFSFGSFQRVWFSLERSTAIHSTTTPEPTPVHIPMLDPSRPLGDRQNPVPLGTSAEIRSEDAQDHWEITVIDIHPDATATILGDSFADPPREGNRFYMVTVRAKYLGPESAQFTGAGRLKAVGVKSVVYDWFEDDCGFGIPNELPDPELFAGGQIEGNVCWEIASSDAGSLNMFLDESLHSSSLGGFQRVWFSLRE